ncbi:hypothetical protein [Aestuariibaculum lutulentum]|uniref:Uncharacterized protein n=1 Tax=Aestuariibaculum lutulentum TaxID=2920935 RepID=A0ABS9RGC6_9FLAO|nr:hypothetical protein [Aestuariibaculum lutulentum]MCH4551998.1 hypothetical protein [Aestuariibaculum lutulentum]
MLGFTFKEYKETYKNRLLAYLDDYEDNTPDLFLEDELKTYNAIYNELKFIVDNFDKNFEKEINQGLNRHIYLSIINNFIESQHKFKPIPKPSVPQSIVNFVFQSILNPKPKTTSKVNNISVPQYTKEDLNIILKESWDSSCNEDYIKSNMKKIYNNIITSTKRIIDFINDEKSRLQNSVDPYIKTATKDSSIIIKDHLSNKPKKYSEKWHALAYLLELKFKGLKPPISTEGTFIKSELEKIGKARTGLSGQGFYRAVLKHYDDLGNPELLIKSFGKDWKETILEITKENKDLQDYLDENN